MSQKIIEMKERSMLQKFASIAKVYDEQAAESKGYEKEIYSGLSQSIIFLLKAYPKLKNGTYVYKGEFTEEAMGTEFERLKNTPTFESSFVTTLLCFLNSENPTISHREELIGFLHTVGSFMVDCKEELFHKCSPVLLADVLYSGAIDASVVPIRNHHSLQEKPDLSTIQKKVEATTNKVKLGRSINKNFKISEIGISYLTPKLLSILKEIVKKWNKEDFEYTNEIKVRPEYWYALFDFQAKHNTALMDGRQVKAALKHAFDRNAKEFIDKKVASIKKFCQNTTPYFLLEPQHAEKS